MSTILQNKKATKLTTTEGTLYFQAPEMMQIDDFDEEEEEPKEKEFEGKPLDIWATGITIYVLFYKRLPYSEDSMFDVVEMMDEIAAAEFRIKQY